MFGNQKDINKYLYNPQHKAVGNLKCNAHDAVFIK